MAQRGQIVLGEAVYERIAAFSLTESLLERFFGAERGQLLSQAIIGTDDEVASLQAAAEILGGRVAGGTTPDGETVGYVDRQPEPSATSFTVAFHSDVNNWEIWPIDFLRQYLENPVPEDK
jgi:hypothetical protein